MWPRDMVMRSDFGAAKAAEIAFGLVGANPVIHKRYRVIDAVRLPASVKGIPSAPFIGIDR